MKILYSGELLPGSTSLFIAQALERLGHEVVLFYWTPYLVKNRLLAALGQRLAIGTHATRFNRDLLQAVQREKVDLLWADKLLLLTPQTLERMRTMGVLSVSYMIDNPFGSRRDPGWRMYMKDLPYFDLHVTQRDVSLREYLARGARNVMKVQTAFEPTMHFPPPAPLPDAERTREVSFIGTPYDDRAAVLTRVAHAGLPVVISGSSRLWKTALGAGEHARVFRFGELQGKEYREAIWRSKINLSFLTHSNQDEYAHKSFEIAGCGGFLMAERSEGHSLRFKEDEEAVFFSGTDELIAKIRRYLPDEAARARIAAAGRARAVRDGYSNDVQVARIVERLEQIAAVERTAGAVSVRPENRRHAG